MNKFQDLVKKNKSDLVELADFNSASQLKKAKLIKKIADDSDDYSKNILSLPEKNSGKIKNKAKELGIEYTTKGETISKIAQKSKQTNNESQSKESSLSSKEEFIKAIDLAQRNSLSEKRSYKVLNTNEKNTFNVSPIYMKHDEDQNVLFTVNITEYGKQYL